VAGPIPVSDNQDLSLELFKIMPVQNRNFTTEAPFDRLTALSKVEGLRTQGSFRLSGYLPASAWHWRAGTDKQK